MKLKKIEDVRVGQVWEHNEYGHKVVITGVKIELFEDDTETEIELISFHTYNEPKGYNEEFNLEDFNLIGFIGITHQEQDGKLVEIPRKDIEVDDIVMVQDEPQLIISHCPDKYYFNLITSKGDLILNYPQVEEFKKIGTIGVNYEIVNSALKVNNG